MSCVSKKIAKKDILEGLNVTAEEMQLLEAILDKEYEQKKELSKELGSTNEVLMQYAEELVDKAPSNKNNVWNALNGEITVKYRGAKRVTYKIKDIVVDSELNTTIQTEEGLKFKFRQGQDRSLSFGANNYVEVEGLKDITNNYMEPKTEARVVEEFLYGNREDIRKGAKLGKKFWNKFKELDVQLHKDVTKTVEMLDTINELDGNITDAEHMEHLRGLLGSMNPKFFRNMKVYLMEKAAETGGVVTANKIGVMVSKTRSIAGNSMTAAEVYAHEIMHAYTMFAIEAAKNGDVEARKILRQLQSTMDVMRANTKWQDLLGKPEDEANDAEVKNAKEMYEYIFNSKNAEDEFLAHVSTNRIVKELASKISLKEVREDKTVLDKVVSMVKEIIKYMKGEFAFNKANKSVYEATVALAGLFAEYNNRNEQRVADNQSMVARLADVFNEVEDTVANKMRDVTKKYFPEVKRLGDMPKEAKGKAVWFARAFGAIVTSKDYRRVLSSYLDQLNLLNASGTIASILRDFTERDELEKAIDWLQLSADKIDQSKMNVITTVEDNLKKAFSRKLDNDEEVALTRVMLDTDMQSVYKEYTEAKLVEILENEKKLDQELGKAKKDLEKLDRDNYNWHVNQASGLGYFMVTGKAHIAQNMNAYSIARGYGSRHRKRGYKNKPGDLERAIDKVATLTALKYTDIGSKEIVAKLVRDEKNGVDYMMNTAQFLREEAARTVFNGSEALMIKGYTKELFDNTTSVEIARIADKKEMENRGYKLVAELENHSLVSSTEKYGVYRSEHFGRADWHRSATRLTKMHTKGTDLKDVWYGETGTYNDKQYRVNKISIDNKRQELMDKMEEGEVNLEELEYGLAALTDEYGDVVGYRYMMDKKLKEELLKQDKTATKVLGHTRGNILDKDRTAKHNVKVLDLIKEDADENYIPGEVTGKNGAVYVLISENSPDEEIQDLWRVLPKEFKREALRNAEKGLAVRKDMLHTYFGYREVSFADFPGLEKVMPQMLKNAIKIAETIWMEFIKIVKIDILIKMPFVIVGNVLSNIVYALTTGSSPSEILTMYRESVRDVRDYLVKHREMVKLEELVNAGINVEANKSRIKGIKHQLEVSPIHELYELGVYQAIVEDVSKEELSSQNKLKRKFKEYMESKPKIVKDGLNWLYLTEETQYYKFMTEALQMSDLVARDIENRKMKKVAESVVSGKRQLPIWYMEYVDELLKEKPELISIIGKDRLDDPRRKMTNEEKRLFMEVSADYRKNQVLTNFVNYNKVSGPSEEYLNKMGFVMFTKYAKRIQRVIAETGLKYPIRSLLVLFTDSYVWDMETIQDQSIFTRSWYNVQPQYPWERVMEVMTPALVQMPKNLGI